MVKLGCISIYHVSLNIICYLLNHANKIRSGKYVECQHHILHFLFRFIQGATGKHRLTPFILLNDHYGMLHTNGLCIGKTHLLLMVIFSHFEVQTNFSGYVKIELQHGFTTEYLSITLLAEHGKRFVFHQHLLVTRTMI